MREDSPHATWALLFYSLQCRFDYWLRHVPPEFCWEPASRIDEALERAVTSLGYAGMLDDITRRRFRLPAGHIHGHNGLHRL